MTGSIGLWDPMESGNEWRLRGLLVGPINSNLLGVTDAGASLRRAEWNGLPPWWRSRTKMPTKLKRPSRWVLSSSEAQTGQKEEFTHPATMQEQQKAEGVNVWFPRESRYSLVICFYNKTACVAELWGCTMRMFSLKDDGNGKWSFR